MVKGEDSAWTWCGCGCGAGSWSSNQPRAWEPYAAGVALKRKKKKKKDEYHLGVFQANNKGNKSGHMELKAKTVRGSATQIAARGAGFHPFGMTKDVRMSREPLPLLPQPQARTPLPTAPVQWSSVSREPPSFH